ncbi:AraC family transcriptional regulator [Comamonas sp.]|jgi:AraC-like DNA-binding protein|uniref:AraC family transcriptional regulator n=1 Tax=Comamonas sp. TaxID=34028 RepID=UPI002852EBAA|nr:AraC family transcriptional regulator [Comamonas sp.]
MPAKPADSAVMTRVRAASLAGFEDLVRAQGGDPAALLSACGLVPEDLADPERYLPGHAVALAIEEAARVLGVHDFGLRLCARQGVETLGLLGLVIQSAPTIREGMMQGGKYVRFHNPTLSYRTFMEPDEGLECVEVLSHLSPHDPMPQGTEICVAYMCRLIHVLSEGALRPAAIHLRHAPVGSSAQYRRHLGQLPRFRSRFDGIAIDPLAWRQPMPRHNRLLQQFVERFLLGARPGGETSVTDQVRGALANLVRVGMADLPSVARALGQHPRTLQRRLQAEGAAFEELRDTARRDWVAQLLAQPDLSLGHIAQLLGYSDQAVLTRACQRWFGQPPSRLRHRSRRESTT